MSWSLLQSWEVVVAQLVERSLSTPVGHGSNPRPKLYSKEEYWEKEAWNGPFVFKKTFAKLSTCLTFARASSAVLAVDIFADAVASSILRSGVVAFPASELETVCTARRPRSPRWPFTIDGWADLVARLLLNVRTFAARSAVDWGRLVAGSSPLPDATSALCVALGPLRPSSPFSRNWKLQNNTFLIEIFLEPCDQMAWPFPTLKICPIA